MTVGPRVRFALAALVISVLSFGSAAYAASTSGHVYDDWYQCVWNHTYQGGSYNEVQLRSTTSTHWFYADQRCAYNHGKPDGYLAAMWAQYKWSFNQNTWLLCGSQGYNYGGGDSLTVGRHVSRCGSGWYIIGGGTYVYNGGWLGGWLWTDYEWF